MIKVYAILYKNKIFKKHSKGVYTSLSNAKRCITMAINDMVFEKTYNNSIDYSEKDSIKEAQTVKEELKKKIAKDFKIIECIGNEEENICI